MCRGIGIVSVVASFLFCLTTASQAQGIAFSEAVEQSSGVCFGDNPVDAMQCARDKCAAGGAEARDCLRVKWCYPAGWSADIFLQHQEGPHWHEYLCGWDSRESVLRAAEVACDRSLRSYLIECSAVRLWSPEGVESEPR
ncbi:MAG: hypothetical protein AB3N20_19995 [Rhizobiaceae bacterium]